VSSGVYTDAGWEIGPMGALSGIAIKQRLAAPKPLRLVISPLLEPTDRFGEEEASIDIHLGFTFAAASNVSEGAIYDFEEVAQGNTVATVAAVYKTEYIPIGGKLVIEPGQYVTATSLEYIRLPRDLLAQVVGKTSALPGLRVETLAPMQPHFVGTLSLKLRNYGDTPIALYPGETVAQMSFHTAAGLITAGPGVDQYLRPMDGVRRPPSKPREIGRLVAANAINRTAAE
jgi:dCTP deaminase